MSGISKTTTASTITTPTTPSTTSTQQTTTPTTIPTTTQPFTQHPNPTLCVTLGLQCKKCSSLCGMGGWCVVNALTNEKCVCDYGWTGPGGRYVTDFSSRYPLLVKNRIRARDCKRYCNYSPYFRYSLQYVNVLLSFFCLF